MNRRRLGQNGPLVSEIALGTVKIGRTEGLKYPGAFGLPNDGAVRDLLARARELGVSLIDTAPAYGTAESRLGVLLPGSRDDWFISTKAGESFENGESRFDFTPEAILASLDRSLDALRVDHADALLIHSDGMIESELVTSGVLGALQRAKDSGKARLIGVSPKTLDGARLAIEHTDIVMLTFNPIDTQMAPMIELARERGVGVLVKKALASGHVADLPDTPGLDPAQSAIRFSLNTPGVTSVVVGTTNPEHLAAAVHAADMNPQIHTPSRPAPGRARS